MSPSHREASGNLFELEPLLGAPRRLTVARVALSRPLPEPLGYEVPSSLRNRLQRGHQVRVPLGRGEASGFVVDIREEAPRTPLKSILRLEGREPMLSPLTLELGLWVARHYGASPGEALQALVPAPVRRQSHPRPVPLLTLSDLGEGARLLEKHQGEAPWRARCRIIKEFLADPRPRTAIKLCRQQGVSLSPVRTLARAGILVEAADTNASLARRDHSLPASPPPTLTPHQARALQRLSPLLAAKRPARALLHGVTGSGKTEVYLRLLEAVLKQGRGAIVLVPEIALTPQTVERLRARLPAVALLHSNLSAGERARRHEWLRRGDVRVALGPRSAIFAPISGVGLIVMDEEHETTFKQNQAPRYQTRDVAWKRAQLEGALLLMGTATPSLEMEAACRAGAVQRMELPERVRARPFPRCTTIDMRQQQAAGPRHIFSRPLLVAMEQSLKRREQVLLFLNRRGFSTSVLCRRCGWKASCPLCDINLTHYRQRSRLLCHYCGHEEPAPSRCPDCGSFGVLFEGVGTERVAAAAKRLFPAANVARMDGESLRKRGEAERIFQALKEGAIDILVGTQLVAKGLDIPGISLVGVISADTALLMPDFRSAERTYQILSQVAGRAGRGSNPGQVLIQTWTPDHPAIRAAASHDPKLFLDEELNQRRTLGYPPYQELLRLVLEGPEQGRLRLHAQRLKESLLAAPPARRARLKILGPAPCPLPLIKGQQRIHLLLGCPDQDVLTELLPCVPKKLPRGMKLILDRDPVSLL